MSDTTTDRAPALIPDEVIKRFDDLLPAVNTGDQRAARALTTLCREHPELWRHLGDLQVQAERSWVDVLVPGASDRDAFNRATIEQGMNRRRQELARNGSSPLENILIDRIISSWLQVTYAELKYTQTIKDGAGTYERAEFYQKLVDRAQRQLLRATQSLATVRRLIAPTQVNIGQNQINVVG